MGLQLGQKHRVHREGESSKLEAITKVTRGSGAMGHRSHRPWNIWLSSQNRYPCSNSFVNPSPLCLSVEQWPRGTHLRAGKKGDALQLFLGCLCDPVTIPVAQRVGVFSRACICCPPSRLRLPGPEEREVGSA